MSDKTGTQVLAALLQQEQEEQKEQQGAICNATNSGAGFSLIEVLVTLLLLGIGFTNLTGLQAAAKKANYDSLQRTTAVILARDIVEMMRANPGSLDSYLTAGTGIGGNALSEPEVNCRPEARCNVEQLANYDMWHWEQMLDGVHEAREINGELVATGGLVNPAAWVQAAPASAATGNADAYLITVVWRGLHPLDNISDANCGVGRDYYGAEQRFRRSVTLTTQITSR